MSKFVVLETFNDIVNIVTNSSGDTSIFETLQEAQEIADLCQRGIVVPISGVPYMNRYAFPVRYHIFYTHECNPDLYCRANLTKEELYPELVDIFDLCNWAEEDVTVENLENYIEGDESEYIHDFSVFGIDEYGILRYVSINYTSLIECIKSYKNQSKNEIN
nr:MAG TPA: hypothetical protein [Caudoviricetes sp.]